MKAIDITLRTGQKLLINEEQVVSVHPPEKSGLTEGFTRLKMSNGDDYFIIAPPYDEWHNDLFIK